MPKATPPSRTKPRNAVSNGKARPLVALPPKRVKASGPPRQAGGADPAFPVIGLANGQKTRSHRGHRGLAAAHDLSRVSNVFSLTTAPTLSHSREFGHGPTVSLRKGRVLPAGAVLPSYFATTRAGLREAARQTGGIPAADGAVTTTRAPEVFDIVDENGLPGTRIRHSELIQDFTVAAITTAFEAAALAINPGLEAVFPWLSQAAEAFTSYSFKELGFEYVPRVGTVNDGSVFMAPAPNVQDPLPTTEEELSAYVGAAQTAVYNDFSVQFDPEAMTYGDENDTKYVRTGLEAGDPKTFDSGQLIMASAYGPSATPIVGGGLWAHYDVELFEAKENDSQQETIASLVTVGAVADALTVATGTPAIVPYEVWYPTSPDALFLTSLNTLSLQTMTSLGLAGAIKGVWYIPRGRYQVELFYNDELVLPAGAAATTNNVLQAVKADAGDFPIPTINDLTAASQYPSTQPFRVLGRIPELVNRNYIQGNGTATANRLYESFSSRFYIEADVPTWFAVKTYFTVTTGAADHNIKEASAIHITPA